MLGTALNLSDLRRILREVAGTEPGVDLDADIMDTPFIDLGYDSIALLETAARILQEFGLRLSDDAVVAATCPRLLLDQANSPDARA